MKSVPNLLSIIRYNINPDSSDSDKIAGNPYDQFRNWTGDASLNGTPLPDSISLKMEDPDDMNGDFRIVVIKGFINGRFIFFTNYDGTRGNNLPDTYASIALLWRDLYKRIKITGRVQLMPKEESDRYYSNKPLISQIHSDSDGEKQFIGDIILPDSPSFSPGIEDVRINWRGFYLFPRYFEFCHGHQFLLNYRIKYSIGRDNAWNIRRLFPLSLYG
ncbi:MAG TPA: pyridoxine 5'-phosphate oxidase C-terminal domain-containing protein [Bacteroidales bacterium]|nr:pyridoxine 5'-phosphate oxidase C-terminal domain-containing protein [Bacteroidales bacterium]